MTEPFIRPGPPSRPALRLIVFHHAGGSASAYYPLAQHLPDDWDVLLWDIPGRGKSVGIEQKSDMPSLVATVLAEIIPWTGLPFAVFGHSLGAALAGEVARGLQHRGSAPVWVGVSGRSAPDGYDAEAPRLARLPDRELLGRLRAMGGMPDRFNELPVPFRERLLEVVRRDLDLVETYRPDPERARLTMPVTAFGGHDDALAPPADTAGWARETTGTFRHLTFAGGHFYFRGSGVSVLARAIADEVNRYR